MAASTPFLPTFTAAIGHNADAPIEHDGPHADGPSSELPSAYAVTDFAVDSVANAALATRALQQTLGATSTSPILVNRRLASLWFGWTIQPQQWQMDSAWDEIAGIYQTSDGHIRLHTNAPHHRRAAVDVLGCADERSAVTDAALTWSAHELQEAVYASGGVAVALNDRQSWSEHPQGKALAQEPLVHTATNPTSSTPTRSLTANPERPLDGVRVLDLTRVLAGPVATRFLAGLGADVLRIDPPTWNEPGVIPEVTLGKRCARLDLKGEGRETFTYLLESADILVHGYRPGALEGLGFGIEQRRSINPGLVDVSLNAWGHSGPWANRRGFDSIVQIACGIAAEGQSAYESTSPTPLPVQALDHATGYTLAAAAIEGWRQRLITNAGSTWRSSLAAHAELLCSGPAGPLQAEMAPLGSDDLEPEPESTSWGMARRARPPVNGLLRWESGASELGSTPTPAWRP